MALVPDKVQLARFALYIDKARNLSPLTAKGYLYDLAHLQRLLQ